MPRKKRKKEASAVIFAPEPTIQTCDRVQLRDAAGMTLFATRNRGAKRVTFKIGVYDGAQDFIGASDESVVLFCEKLIALTKKKGNK